VTSSSLPSKLVCAGCGAEIPADEPFPFRCPRADEDAAAGGDVDHVLRRELGPSFLSAGEARELFLDPEPNPFLRYRRLLHSHIVGLSQGLTDPEYIELVERLDQAVAKVDGRAGKGFVETPFQPEDELGRHLGLSPEQLWVKDETGNVSGSHKGRHLQGVMIWLEVRCELARERGFGESGRAPVAGGAQTRSARPSGWVALRPHRSPSGLSDAGGDQEGEPHLAIASCGNAALAAAVVARAAGRPLDVYVPPDAHPRVLERLQEHGAHLTPCPRTAGETGDPCFRRFREAVTAGALPFTCQGSENGLVIEGGKTLVWEMASRLLEQRPLDRLLIQVGGGALASSCIQGLDEAKALGVLPRLPRIHTVQTEGASPLRRAWRRVVERLLGETGQTDAAALTDAECARRVAELPERRIDVALRHAAHHRSEYMWPWETEPRSLATGILDDETYDWLSVVEGLVRTGGWPLVASEAELAEAHRAVREHTGVPADPTGTAGVAGLLPLIRGGEMGNDERVAVLLTGARR